jgi:acetylornithine/succinyldiaminopimelate/putrescine aminotransferase
MLSDLINHEQHGARNYHPLPVMLQQGEGVWVTDINGERYLDMLAAYSALNFGHRHPRLVAALARATAGTADIDEPRLPQRPARPLHRGSGGAVRDGCRAAHEHRSRGGRDRDQGSSQVGL